jgi:zinc transport system permease protein
MDEMGDLGELLTPEELHELEDAAVGAETSGHGPSWGEFFDSFDIFGDAIFSGVVGGAVLGFLGVYVVLRRVVFVSAAVTQSAGLGVALAFYLQIHVGWAVDPVVGATGLALLASLLFIAEPRAVHLSRESILGLAFALAGGVAVLIESRITQEAHDLHAILFGPAVIVIPEDARAIYVAAAIIMAIHLWMFRGLTFASFDPTSARVQGLPVHRLNAIVLLSIGLMVGITARALGAMPVFALSTMPAVAALATGARMRATFIIAALLGALSGIAGYVLAYFKGFPVGPSQTTVAALLAVTAILIGSSIRGSRSALAWLRNRNASSPSK